MLRYAVVSIAVVLMACSTEHAMGDATTGGAGLAGQSEHQGADWDQVRTSFSILTTIAGQGESDNGNEWQERFEAGLATDAELSRPHMAMADGQGNVYIADKESHGIRQVTLDGRIHTVAGTNVSGDALDDGVDARKGALSDPNGIWVQPDGTLYILDLGNAKVRRVTPDGIMSTLIELQSLSTGRGLWVAVDESEALIAAGSELLSWTASDGVRTLASGFGSLGMVLKTPDGRILVGDRGGMRVYEVHADGKKTAMAGNGGAEESFVDGAKATETAFDEPRAIWPYAGGILVGLHNGCKIIYVDSEGFAHLMLQGSSSSHSGDGAPYDPSVKTIGEMRSVTVTSHGDIIFVENDVGYVRQLSAVP
jgi:hypothetical protein